MINDDALAAASLRFALVAEGLGIELAELIARDVQRALRAVQDRLAAILPGEAPATVARLETIRGELVALRDALSARIAGRIDEHLAALAEAAASAAARAAADASQGQVRVRLDGVPLARILAVRAQPHDGHTWASWGRRLSDDAMRRVTSELAEAAAAGEALPDIARRLGTVLDLSRTSAMRLARTASNDVGNRALVTSMREVLGDAIRGYRFVATLDGRTSLICAALDGTVWAKDAPDVQRPPLHPNCRSVLVPITSPNAKPEGDRPWSRATEANMNWRRMARDEAGEERWKAMHEKQRLALMRKTREAWQAKNIGITSATTYADWLARQPAPFVREVLGPTRFEAWKRGLPLSAMATTTRPLSIAELRRLYPNAMQGL